MKKSKVVKIIITITVSVILGVGMLFWYIFLGGIPQIATEVENYGEFDGFSGYSNLMIFPEKLLDSAEDVEYYYYNRDTFMNPTCQVYLKCTYDKEAKSS